MGLVKSSWRRKGVQVAQARFQKLWHRNMPKVDGQMRKERPELGDFMSLSLTQHPQSSSDWLGPSHLGWQSPSLKIPKYLYFCMTWCFRNLLYKTQSVVLMFSLCVLSFHMVVFGQECLEKSGRKLPSTVPRAETMAPASAKSPAWGKMLTSSCGTLDSACLWSAMLLPQFFRVKAISVHPLQRKTDPGDLKGSCQNK